MAEMPEFSVIRWRYCVCWAACVILSPFPMPDRWAEGLLDRMANWTLRQKHQ